MAHCRVLIGTFLSNFMRLPMEFRARRYVLASGLFMELGELPCVSMAHCDYHHIRWIFDFRILMNFSWEHFDTPDFRSLKIGDALTQAFGMKFAKPNILPPQIEEYLRVRESRTDWAIHR
jgi:hypothetical protein